MLAGPGGRKSLGVASLLHRLVQGPAWPTPCTHASDESIACLPTARKGFRNLEQYSGSRARMDFRRIRPNRVTAGSLLGGSSPLRYPTERDERPPRDVFLSVVRKEVHLLGRRRELPAEGQVRLLREGGVPERRAAGCSGPNAAGSGRCGHRGRRFSGSARAQAPHLTPRPRRSADPERHEPVRGKGSDPGQRPHVGELHGGPLPPAGLPPHNGDR